MKVLRHAPRSFLRRASPLLERSEAENNLLFGLALSLEAGATTLSAAPLCATIEDGDEVVAAAFRTPPHYLVITRASPPSLEALANALRADGGSLPGVIGPAADAAEFAALWAGDARELVMRQGVYACERVAAVPVSAGELRAADDRDTERLAGFAADFARSFHADIGQPADERRARGLILQHLSDRSVFVWDDGQIVCMTVVKEPTPHGIRVSGVYTPPEHRRRGYATSCVAAVTRRMLESRRFCCLYTDLADPTSNALYRRIGYEPVCESAMWRLLERAP